jgi:hypothetical protein
MPEKDTSQSPVETSIDLGELELEIDKEIDALLVPAGQKAKSAAGVMETTSEAQVPSLAETDRENRKSGAMPSFDLDLDDFKVEMEKEIDSLFVPAAESRNERPVTTGIEKQWQEIQTLSRSADEKEVLPIPIQSAKPSQAAVSNERLDDFQTELENEIDNLFVPAVQYWNQGPARTGDEVFTPAVSMTVDRMESLTAPAITDPSIQFSEPAVSKEKLDDIRIEIEKEIDNIFVPAAQYWNQGSAKTGDERFTPPVSATVDRMERVAAPEKADPLPQRPQGGAAKEMPDNAAALALYHSNYLAEAIERFKAAYLSFDWELSKSNIQKFISALNGLEPFALRSAETKSVLRLMEIILKRLLDRPHAVNSILIRLIRDSHSLLACMLLDGETGPDQKQQIKELFARFDDLRQRALAAKAGAGKQNPEVSPPKQPEPVCVDEIPPARETPPVILSSAADTGLIEELRDWMDRIQRSLSENIKVIDAEIARFRQIEATLAKNTDLASVARRLNGIGNALESQVSVLRNKEAEFSGWISRISELQTAHAHSIMPARNTELVAPTGEKTGVNVYSESLYLIASNGKCLALPAGCVLKVARSFGRTQGRILKRGYATLDDFRLPFLHWIRSGVLGEWAKRPRRELNSYRFQPVEPCLFERGESRGRVAVLASDGNEHAVLFADSVDLIADPQVAAGTSDNDDPGASETLRALFPLAFDPGIPVSLPDQISGIPGAAGFCRE